MPITKSAKKALRSSFRKRAFNLERKEKFQKALKNFRKLVAEKKKEAATTAFREVQKSLDKLAKAGYIKKNAAARKKSRLYATIKKLS